MTYEEVLLRLANHANMVDDDSMSSSSLVYNLWNSTTNIITNLDDLNSLRNDIINLLEFINQHINGTLPSMVVNKQSNIVDTQLVLYICIIIDSCVEYSLIWDKHQMFSLKERSWLRETTWMISYAWCAILHGDIDSLYDDINTAIIAKNIHSK